MAAPDLLARLEDWIDRAERTWQVVVSDMLSPPDVQVVEDYCRRLSTVQWVAWGGYPQAERVRVALAPAAMSLSTADVPLALLGIQGNFLFDPASHRDFLGAILATGIVRDKVGDLLVLGERGAQVIVVPELADFLCAHLTQVRSVPVTVSRLDWSELRVPEPRTKELTTVEASLRLDALASAGFGLSRTKMVAWIKQGRCGSTGKPSPNPVTCSKLAMWSLSEGKGG